MTMQNPSHPDDERLAAYAGGDRDAVADPSLSAHVGACDRCGPMVDELAGLRLALAELPDLAPSRPLRLIPPVPTAPGPRPTPLGWLRRLAGPAMAAGAGLVLIGAIGLGQSGAVTDLFGKAASGGSLQAAGASEREAAASAANLPGAYSPGTPMATSNETRGTTDSAASAEPPSTEFSHGSSPAPVSEGPGRTEHLSGGSSSAQPWLTLLIAGTAVFVLATVLRFSIAPRAG
jgi:hypothetical protein